MLAQIGPTPVNIAQMCVDQNCAEFGHGCAEIHQILVDVGHFRSTSARIRPKSGGRLPGIGRNWPGLDQFWQISAKWGKDNARATDRRSDRTADRSTDRPTAAADRPSVRHRPHGRPGCSTARPPPRPPIRLTARETARAPERQTIRPPPMSSPGEALHGRGEHVAGGRRAALGEAGLVAAALANPSASRIDTCVFLRAVILLVRPPLK